MFLLLRHAIETAPLEAGKRIRFQGFGHSNYRSREMGEALRTLERAMLITLVHPVTSTRLPLVPDLKKSPRLQFIDSGLRSDVPAGLFFWVREQAGSGASSLGRPPSICSISGWTSSTIRP